MKNRLTSVMGVALFLSGILSAQSFQSLDDIKAYARENSLAYKKALWDASKAGHAREGFFRTDETSFTMSRGYDDRGEEWSASSGVILPLLDQISLKGTLYDDDTSELGLSFTPLSHSDDREQRDIDWQMAVAFAEETAVTAENTGLSAALNWMVTTSQLAIQEELVHVQETIYRDERVRYDAGEATLDDVRDALVDWTEARTEFSRLQTQLRETELELMTALNVNPESMDMVILGWEELEQKMETLHGSLSLEQGDPSREYSVLSAYLDMKRVEEELEDTWVFDPTLTLDGSLNLEEDSRSWEASVQLSFSLEDWRKDEREELRTDLDLSRQEAYQAEQEARLIYQQALIALENTKQIREVTRLEQEQAEDLYEEALFLYQLGEYSEAERDDAALSLRSAEISLLSAFAEEYLAWREILLYLP